MTKGLSSHKLREGISKSIINEIRVEDLVAEKPLRKLRLKLRLKVDERVGDVVFAYIWNDLYEGNA